MGNPPPTKSEKSQDHGAPAQLPQGCQRSPAVGLLTQSTAKKKREGNFTNREFTQIPTNESVSQR